MIKKVYFLILCIIISGCSPKPSSVEEIKPYFVFAAPLVAHPVWLQSKAGFLQACTELNLRCDWIGPTPIDTKKMEDTINTAVMQKADAIITQGVVSKHVIEYAMQHDIGIALVDSDIGGLPDHIYLGKDFTRQAELLLNDIEEHYGKDKYLKIAIQVAALDFTIAQQQIKQIQNIFRSHPGGYSIVATSESLSDKARSQKKWEEIFNNEDINVAINFAGEGTSICGKVAKEKGCRKHMLIYGVDDMSETITAIKDGSIDGSIVTSFYNYGYLSVYKLFDDIFKQHHSISERDSEIMMVNIHNVDKYIEELK